MKNQLTDNSLSFKVVVFHSYWQFGKITAFVSVLTTMLTCLINTWNTNIQRCKLFRYPWYWLCIFSCQYTENALVGPIFQYIESSNVWGIDISFENLKTIASLPMLSQYSEQHSVRGLVYSRTSVILMLSVNTPNFHSRTERSAWCGTLGSYSDLQ